MPFRETPWVRSEEGALAFRASEDRIRRLPLRELLLDPAILDNRFPGERLAHNFACVAELSFVRRHEQKGIAEPTLRCAAPHQSIECCVSGGDFAAPLPACTIARSAARCCAMSLLSVASRSRVSM